MGDFQPPIAPEPVPAPEPAPAPVVRSPILYLITALLWLVISLTLAASKWIQHRFSGAEAPPLTFTDWLPTIVASLAVGGALALLAAATHAFLKYLKPIAAVAGVLCLAWLAMRLAGVV